MERSALHSPCHTRDSHLGQTNGSHWRSHGVAMRPPPGLAEPGPLSMIVTVGMIWHDRYSVATVAGVHTGLWLRAPLPQAANAGQSRCLDGHSGWQMAVA